MVDAHKNFAYSTVATAPSPATSGTTLSVQAGDGALFPAVPFNATAWPTNAQPLATNAEIIRVTDITGDVLTFTRAQEGTSAKAISVGYQIAETITAKALTDVEALPAAAVAAHVAATDPHGDRAYADTLVGVSTGRNAVTGKFHVTGYGAKADAVCKQGSGATMSNGSAVLTDSAGTFTAGDVGKVIVVNNAKGAGVHLYTTIASRQSATQVTLTSGATATVSNAIYAYGTDDSTAWQNCVNAAQAVNGTIQAPGSPSMITTALSVTAACSIDGTGVMGIHGSRSVSDESLNLPVSAPFIVGSVIMVGAANTNGITITGAGLGVRLRGFGILFAGLWKSTGHGIHYSPPAYLSYQDNGLMDAMWSDLVVYGTDGDHYGYYLVNTLCSTFVHLHAFGGGIIRIDNNTPSIAYGNATLIHPYGQILCNGSAHGIWLSNTHNVGNMFELFQPQVSHDYNGSTLFPSHGIVSPTQDAIRSDGYFLGMYGADFETGSKTIANPGINNGLFISPDSQFTPSDWGDGSNPTIFGQFEDGPSKMSRDWALIAPRTDVIGLLGPAVLGITQGGYAAPGGRPVYSDGAADFRYYDGTVAYVAGTPGGSGAALSTIAGGPAEDWNVNSLGLSDGGTISSLTGGGSGAHALVPISGTTGPTYKTGVCNSLAVARFDGISNLIQATFTLNQPYTMIFVMRSNRVFGGTQDFVSDGVTDYNAFQVQLGYTGLWAGTGFSYAGAPTKYAWKIISIVVNGASSKLRSNGTQIATGDSGSKTPGGFTLGGSHTKSNFHIMDVARVVIWSSALNATDLQNAERNLGTTYAIAAA